MLRIDFTTLNELEKKIHETLTTAITTQTSLRITEAAALCGCSVSKISKCSKKLGFSNFKQYVDFLYNKDREISPPSTELGRIQNFITHFDQQLVDEMITLIESHERVVLFGYGPSLLCAQYIEYRLRTATNKVIIAVVDDLSVASMTDNKTLLIMLTVTGKYRDFKNIYESATIKRAKVVIVAQYYNKTLIDQCDKIFFLTDETISQDLIPYEQSRSLIFIFMEEVIQRIALIQKRNNI